MILRQIFEMEILIDLHVLRTPNPKVTVLAVTSTVISITQNQMTAETSNLVFYICIIRRCYLKPFMKIGLKLCTGVYKRILTHPGLWTEYLEVSGIPEYLNQ